MSVTPPPTYSPGPLDGAAADLKQALTQATAPIAAKHLNVENPVPVNVFNYTGAVFDNDEEYEYAEFLGGTAVHQTPALGVEVRGVKLQQLSKAALDDLALLVAERGVVVFRKQTDLTIEEQLAVGAHWGPRYIADHSVGDPVHVHATTGVPRREGLEHVHVVYADKGARPDPTAFAKIELFHSDVTYELQPPGPTLLRNLVTPDLGGDTLFSSGAAVFSSFSPPYQRYLESLSAVHSGHEQARGARGAGQHVRREPIETVHPIVRVCPSTGIKSVFVNAGFTRRIVGVPKAESDHVLSFLHEQFAVNHDFAWRVKWEKDDVAIWDNRVVNHSALFDFWPERRHAVRVTPQAERPESVAEYEARTGTKAKDWLEERYKAIGIVKPALDAGVGKKERGFKD
ncbi:hypothetical protein QFC19_008647 [Naganishia cerealis]|uniref:Uncharacterized protein n=1 Tax=Naganishia cerealis TaxID=610337 RepID=A0ACC2V0F5_9TREE|nr:hypothetical protein QFC19_008647 [Naganishia cerealis]